MGPIATVFNSALLWFPINTDKRVVTHVYQNFVRYTCFFYQMSRIEQFSMNTHTFTALLCMYIYICECIGICVFMYIYIHRETDRDEIEKILAGISMATHEHTTVHYLWSIEMTCRILFHFLYFLLFFITFFFLIMERDRTLQG